MSSTVHVRMARNAKVVETPRGPLLVDGKGAIVVNDDGTASTTDDLLAALLGRTPHAAPTQAARPANLTTAFIAENKRMRAADAAQATEGPNPWAKSTWSITRQMIVENRDADEAARLQAEAT